MINGAIPVPFIFIKQEAICLSYHHMISQFVGCWNTLYPLFNETLRIWHTAST